MVLAYENIIGRSKQVIMSVQPMKKGETNHTRQEGRDLMSLIEIK